MAITVANPFNAFLQGRQARSQMQQDERKNALLDMQIQNAPAEQERQNKLLDLQAQNYEGQIADRQRSADAATAATADQRKQRGVTQLSNLARQSLASPNPRAFVQQAAQNPAYAEFFRDAGMDPSKLDFNSPTFDQDLQTWASLGDQVSADDRFRAQENEKQRKFTAAENAANRKNQVDVAGMRGQPGTAAPSGYRYNPDGSLQPIPGGPQDPSAPGNKPKATEGERAAANYLLRMGEAEPLIAGFKPSVKDQVAFSRALNSDSELVSALGNSALSPAAQSYFQAASDWVRAKLRKESGAVIAPEEMVQEIKTYFPMPGDSDKVVEQKRQARLTAQEGMRGMAGGAAPPQEPPPDQGGAPKQIKSEAEYGALPSGAKYIGPDGKMRQKR